MVPYLLSFTAIGFSRCACLSCVCALVMPEEPENILEEASYQEAKEE